jgi:ATP synthase protein I
MARKDGHSEFEDFDARMRRLQEGGEQRRAAEPGWLRIGGTGVQAGVELVAGVIGGALLGYGLDSWFETWPLLFIVFFFLGAAAGMLNAYRYIRRASMEPEDRSERK